MILLPCIATSLLALGIAGAVTAAVGATAGAAGSAIHNKKMRDMIQGQRDENRQWYNAKKAEDYTLRTDSQAVINKQRELLSEHYKNARGTNVVAGGSDEALALQQQAANNAMADTMQGIAANASAYKEGIERQYREEDNRLVQQMAGTEAAQAKAAAEAGSQVAQAGVNMAGSSFTEWAKAKGN